MQQRLPKLVALALSALVTFLIVTIFASLIAWAFGRVARDVAGKAAHFQMLHDQAVLWLEQRGIVVAGVWAEYFNMAWLVRIAQQLLGTINSTLTFALVVLIYVVLGLLEVEDSARRLNAMTSRDWVVEMFGVSRRNSDRITEG